MKKVFHKKEKKDSDVVESDNSEKEVATPVVEQSHDTPPMSMEEMQALVEKNIKWSQVIYNQNKKIQRRLTMMVVGSYIRLFLILAPIIIGIMYLPAFIGTVLDQYGGGTSMNNFDIKTIMNVLKSGVTTPSVEDVIQQYR